MAAQIGVYHGSRIFTPEVRKQIIAFFAVPRTREEIKQFLCTKSDSMFTCFLVRCERNGILLYQSGDGEASKVAVLYGLMKVVD